MLKKRVVTALWAVPLVVLAVWFDRPLPWLTILGSVIAVLGVSEFYRLTGVYKIMPLTIFGLAWTLLLIVLPLFNEGRSLSPAVTGGVTLSLILLLFLRGKEGAFQNWAWMAGGVFYVGWLLSLLVTLRLEAGRNWVFFALFATFASDTAAYFIGKAFGRHKLAPAISPGKTWEGAAAGVAGAIIACLLFTLPTELHLSLNILEAVVLGALVSVFGQCGDLAESLLKRNCKVKDSGKLMPGHGGILDRIDSVLFAGALVYLYYILVMA
jgi:phosphatidate cytidylyltransferase